MNEKALFRHFPAGLLRSGAIPIYRLLQNTQNVISNGVRNLTSPGIIEVTDFSLRSRHRASLWENDKNLFFSLDT
jgi:hypothetical protein